jgi:hypothetical protein
VAASGHDLASELRDDDATDDDEDGEALLYEIRSKMSR